MHGMGIVDVWREVNPMGQVYTHTTHLLIKSILGSTTFLHLKKDHYRLDRCEVGPR